MKTAFRIFIAVIVFLLFTIHLAAITLFICPASKLLNAAGYKVEYVHILDVPDHIKQIFVNDIVSLEANREYVRKIPAKVLNLRYDRFFDDNERQELYLNTINFGEDIIGIEKASNYYFNKSAFDLSFEEALTLSGLYKVFAQ